MRLSLYPMLYGCGGCCDCDACTVICVAYVRERECEGDGNAGVGNGGGLLVVSAGHVGGHVFMYCV